MISDYRRESTGLVLAHIDIDASSKRCDGHQGDYAIIGLYFASWVTRKSDITAHAHGAPISYNAAATGALTAPRSLLHLILCAAHFRYSWPFICHECLFRRVPPSFH